VVPVGDSFAIVSTMADGLIIHQGITVDDLEAEIATGDKSRWLAGGDSH
jgi:hypothetical protein